MQEFIAAVANVLGTEQFNDQLETLFTKVHFMFKMRVQISSIGKIRDVTYEM